MSKNLETIKNARKAIRLAQHNQNKLKNGGAKTEQSLKTSVVVKVPEVNTTQRNMASTSHGLSFRGTSLPSIKHKLAVINEDQIRSREKLKFLERQQNNAKKEANQSPYNI